MQERGPKYFNSEKLFIKYLSLLGNLYDLYNPTNNPWRTTMRLMQGCEPTANEFLRCPISWVSAIIFPVNTGTLFSPSRDYILALTVVLT
jgi:hypothetical protein